MLAGRHQTAAALHEAQQQNLQQRDAHAMAWNAAPPQQRHSIQVTANADSLWRICAVSPLVLTAVCLPS